MNFRADAKRQSFSRVEPRRAPLSKSLVMLLREPDGSCSQLFGNGNITDQQQSQRTWVDKTIISNTNTNSEIVENHSNNHNLSLTCRENQLREALAKSLELNVNSSLNYNNNYQSEELSQLESYNLSSNLGNDKKIPSTISDYSPDEGLFEYEEEENSCSSSSTTDLEDDQKILENSGSDDSYSNDSLSYHIPRGIHNPNYPGFQHLAYTLQEYLVDTPSPSENFDITYYHNEDDKSKNKSEDSIFIKDDIERAIENNNNSIVEDDSFETSQISTITKLISCVTNSHKSLLKNDISTEMSSLENEIVLDSSDKNDNVLPLEIDHSEKDIIIDSHVSSESVVNTHYQSIDRNGVNIHDDFVELKKDIYESIQKPIAATLHNISDVVNNVIRYISEQNDSYEMKDLSTVDSQFFIEESLSIENTSNPIALGEDLKILSSISNCNRNNSITTENYSESNGIKMQMDDAYMSNVSENLYLEKNCDEENAIKIIESDMYDINFNKENDVIEIIRAHTNDEMTLGKINNHTNTDVHSSRHIFRWDGKSEKDYILASEGLKKTTKNINRKKTIPESSGEFDVYNIETAMPSIDLDAIENHLRAAREEERRRRNDREEIRRRLAMGAELDEYYTLGDRPGRKPSLQARLQSGMNLQICFMNDTASDTESPCDIEMNNLSDQPKLVKNSKFKCEKLKSASVCSSNCVKVNKDTRKMRPNSLALNNSTKCMPSSNSADQIDFFECQARLQTEARMALAQAKEIARMQMEIERQQQEKSPITEMLRISLEKAGVQFLGDRRRVSRQMLTDINITQLQVIVNELHTQIEFLNESLVELLIARDELHMGQDSMLVDIEDLTRHLEVSSIPIP